MFNWLETPALVTGLAFLLFAVATIIVVFIAVVLAVAIMWMKPSNAERALDVLRELRGLVAALRGAGSSE